MSLTKEDKELIKDLLIFLDLCIRNYENLLNTDGMIAIFRLTEKHKDFSSSRTRYDTISKIIDKLCGGSK